MKFLANLSIKNKLIGIILSVTTFAVILGFFIMMLYNIKSFRNEMLSDMVVNTRLIGEYCVAPLIFQDRQGAESLIEKLETLPFIQSVIVFNENEEEFAAYHRTNEPVQIPEWIKEKGAGFKNDYLYIYQPIFFQQENYGAIFLKATTRLLNDKIMAHLATMLLILGGVIGFSYFIAVGLQSVISKPILQLANMSQKISEEGDYTLRMKKSGNDEIGTLFDSFNDMLEQIHLRQVDRDESAEALRRSEERYALAQKVANIGSWDWNIETGNLFWSEQIEPIFGFKSGEFGKTYDAFLECVHPYDRQFVIDSVNLSIDEDKEYNIRHRIVWPDGTVRWVLETGKVFRDKQGKAFRMLGIVQEITNLVHAELALKENEARYRSLFEDSPISLWEEDFTQVKIFLENLMQNGVTDLDRYFHDHPDDLQHCAQRVQILDVNKATLNLLEAENKASLFEGLPRVFSDESFPVFQKEIVKLAGGSRQFFSEAVQRTLTGQNKQVVLHMNIVPGFEENWGRVIVSLLDITNRKQAEKELKKYQDHLEELVEERTVELKRINEQLEESNRELESFSYSVSHDLRAPLRAINGFSHMLQEDYKDRIDSEGRRLLSIIDKNAVKMGMLVDDLLTFSRLGRKGLRLIPVNMNTLVKLVIKELKGEFPDRKFKFDIQELPESYADRNMIRQVFVNLLSNAVKFTSSGKSTLIQVGGYSEREENVYFVKDNGVGFNMKYAGKLFGVFQRLHAEDEFDGTGVGLALVQRIIHRHGGHVWAEGEEGKGAAFYFSLPVKLGK